jgi:RNA polymerase sigma-70 factor (ECF subfamily)
MNLIILSIIPTIVCSRTNEAWLSDLRSPGPAQDLALADMRDIVLAGLPYALDRWLPADDPKFAPLVEEVAQETLLRVLDHLDTFEGRSQFTTWVYKIAVRVALTELRRKRWENVSLEALLEDNEQPPPRLLANLSSNPEQEVESADMMDHLQRIITEELTEKQRRAMQAIVIKGIPLEEVARRMGTNRNSLYKLMHDTRLRIKRRLAVEGLTPGDLLSYFEKG